MAFTTPPPRRGELIVDGADPCEAQEIHRALQGRRWTAVARDVPRRVSGALSWMTPEGRHHYLPLWLVESFADAEVRGQATFQAWYLVDDPRRRATQLPLYSPAECRAVAACLRHFAAIDATERARALAAAPWWEA